MQTRSLRKLLPAMLAFVLSAALLIGLPVPANAAPMAKPGGVKVVYGDRMLSLSWNTVPAATGYAVQYATNSGFTQAHQTPTSTNANVVIKNLVNKRKYYLRVIAMQGATETYSNSLSSTPLAGYPSVMPTVKVSPGTAPDQIKVSWSSLQRATRVIVIAGSDNQEEGNAFHSAWLPATSTSVTLTVPAGDRWAIGSGTGNAIYVKVAQYNSLTATQILKFRSDTAMYRLSLANVYGFATPLPVTGANRIKVATYNVQSVAASAPGHPWSVRRSRVTNNIVYNNPDLIGLQEDDAAPSMGYQNKQVAADLAPHGYVMSGTLPSNYKYNNDVTDAWIYYKTDLFTRLDGGIISPRDDLNIDWPQGMTDTRGTWTEFKVNTTGSVFYVLDIHLPASGTSSIISLRTREAAALSTFIQAKANGAPTVFLGDFNSAAFRDGYCAPSKLHDLGWYDTTSTLNRSNKDLQTANAPVSYPTGLPERALNVNTGRIDYIMTKNMGGAVSYQNQNILNSDGVPNLTYQGSDHNLQSAILAF